MPTGSPRWPCVPGSGCVSSAASSPLPTSPRSCTTALTSSPPSPPRAGTKPPCSWSTASASGRPPPSPAATALIAPAPGPWKRSTTRPPWGTCTAPSPSTWAGAGATRKAPSWRWPASAPPPASATCIQTQENQQISGALGILTILGLPLGTALGALQVLGDQNPWHLLTATTGALAATAALLTTRYGRLVLTSLRGRPLTDRDN